MPNSGHRERRRGSRVHAFPVELSARGTISAKPGLQAQIYSPSYAALRRRSFTWSFTWGRVHEANRAKPPPCRTERDKDGAPGFGWACRSPRLASFARLTWGTLTFSPVSSSCGMRGSAALSRGVEIPALFRGLLTQQESAGAGTQADSGAYQAHIPEGTAAGQQRNGRHHQGDF